MLDYHARQFPLLLDVTVHLHGEDNRQLRSYKCALADCLSDFLKLLNRTECVSMSHDWGSVRTIPAVDLKAATALRTQAIIWRNLRKK